MITVINCPFLRNRKSHVAKICKCVLSEKAQGFCYVRRKPVNPCHHDDDDDDDNDDSDYDNDDDGWH